MKFLRICADNSGRKRLYFCGVKLVSFNPKGIKRVKRIAEPKYYLTVAATIKNEASYIKEWLDYHISMGVEHFYLYDNESDDNLKEVLAPYIENNYVTYTYWQGKGQQISIYNDALVKYRQDARWIAYIDIDEFICPQNKQSIASFLKDYEKYPALVINWVVFDSNGHKERPQGSVLENYTRAIVGSTHIKSIVDPIAVEYQYVHHARYFSAKKAVNEDFLQVEKFTPPYTATAKIRINHYHSKSKQEFLAKIARGRATRYNGEKYEVDETLYNAPDTIEDRVILKHIGKDF